MPSKSPGRNYRPRAQRELVRRLPYAVLPKEYLAESIIKFHTVVAAPGYALKEGRAAMGEYNHFLTVQELTDLVAFLKQPAKPAGK